MKILHIPFCFYPEPVGGTEIYVAGLAREQQRDGHDVVICAPAFANANYFHEQLAVRRFALGPKVSDVADLYGAGDRHAATRFGEILDEENPDIVHLHAFTRGASLRTVREAKRRNISTVFSYHSPTVSCMRGTLLHNGTAACDGVVNTRRCASCNLDARGITRPWNHLLAGISPALSRSVRSVMSAGSAVTALRMSELVDLRRAAFRGLMHDVDRIVVLSAWTRDLLLRNLVPAGKISLSRQGVSGTTSPPSGPREETATLRIAFVGRLASEKGLGVLIEALRIVPKTPVTLDVFGVSQNHAGGHPSPAADARITFRKPLGRPELLESLQTYDVVAVPSQCLETGPMVVMEAFAAGTPVIGSRLGGIAELVEHDVNGLLIEPRAIQDWAAAIANLAADRGRLARLRRGIRKQRTMRDAAREIALIYDQLPMSTLRQMPVLQ